MTSKEDFRKLMVDDAPVPEAWLVNTLVEENAEDDDSDTDEAASDREWRRVAEMVTWEPWPKRRELWARLAAAAVTLPSRLDDMEKLRRPDPDPPGQRRLTRLVWKDWVPPSRDTIRILSVLAVFACKKARRLELPFQPLPCLFCSNGCSYLKLLIRPNHH